MEEAIIAIGVTLLAAIGVAARWLKVSIERLYSDLKADREGERQQHAETRRELAASREERAECRARLSALEATVEAKLEAAQPRDEDGRFVAERG